ncbi:MAG: GNAT family N-acetyltransferase [Actinomycetes bacterium]
MGSTDSSEGQPFVRPARLIDAEDFAAVQHRSWSAAAEVLGLPAPPDVAHMERSWEHAITVPPTKRHRSWIAVDRSAESETVRGVAALAPASDPDLDGNHCVELVVLAVDPEWRGRGHGSRLLIAAMQTAMDAGEREAVTWVASGDDATRRFFEASRWVADGAFRSLAEGDSDPEQDTELRQVRLATSLESDDDSDEPARP